MSDALARFGGGGEDLLIRLHLVPRQLRVGTDQVRHAVVIHEPDRMSGSMNVGLRMMMSRDAFAHTGLMQLGSRAANRYLFKLAPGAPAVAEVRRTLRRTLPGALIADFRESNPIITRGLDSATTS